MYTVYTHARTHKQGTYAHTTDRHILLSDLTMKATGYSRHTSIVDFMVR